MEDSKKVIALLLSLVSVVGVLLFVTRGDSSSAKEIEKTDSSSAPPPVVHGHGGGGPGGADSPRIETTGSVTDLDTRLAMLSQRMDSLKVNHEFALARIADSVVMLRKERESKNSMGNPKNGKFKKEGGVATTNSRGPKVATYVPDSRTGEAAKPGKTGGRSTKSNAKQRIYKHSPFKINDMIKE